jgi:hypothetical protein
MQAGGDVVRLPVAQEGPLDFAAFFAEEHRELFLGRTCSAWRSTVPEADARSTPGRAEVGTDRLVVRPVR